MFLSHNNKKWPTRPCKFYSIQTSHKSLVRFYVPENNNNPDWKLDLPPKCLNLPAESTLPKIPSKAQTRPQFVTRSPNNRFCLVWKHAAKKISPKQSHGIFYYDCQSKKQRHHHKNKTDSVDPSLSNNGFSSNSTIFQYWEMCAVKL